jgi:hypothetical protein
MTQPSPTPGKTMSIRIRRDHRVFLTGRAGSGKTTLADKLIRRMDYRTAVVDPKGMWDFPGYELVAKFTPGLHRQVFRPEDGAENGWADLVKFMQDAWNDPDPIVVYVDELTECTTPRTAPPIMARWQRLGRQRHKALWMGTQRPRDIPNMFLTETENWFVFDLRHQGDREKVAGFLGERVEARLTERYAFWFANTDMRDAILVHQPVRKTPAPALDRGAAQA